jgi:hypothetical protein
VLLCFSHLADDTPAVRSTRDFETFVAPPAAAGPDGGPADIVWVNRLFGDSFSVYGANETLARSIVDRAIADWERVLVNFNYNDGTNTFNLTLRAESGFPGSSSISDVDAQGKPRAATVRLDDFGGGGQPWYFDPVPGTSTVPDDSEFDLLLSPFDNDSGPVFALDFYMVALHEIGHSLGIGSEANDPVNELAVKNFIDYNAWVIDPNNPDDGCAPNDPNCADPGNHVFPVNFNGGAVDYSMTNAGSGDHPNTYPAHLYEGPAVGGFPIHPNELLNDGRVLDGDFDHRLLISDTTAGFLRDIYGYTVVLPSQINTFYANFNTTTGVLSVQGDPGIANDLITIDVVGATVRVQVNGTTELIPSAQVNQISVLSGEGNDTINIYGVPSGATVSVNASSGDDTINIGNGDIDSTIFGAVTVNSSSGNDALRIFDQNDTGTDAYTITNSLITKPGTVFGGLTYSSLSEIVVLTANELNNVINLESLGVSVSLTINARGGDDQIIVGGQPQIIGETILGNVSINAGLFGNDLVIFNDTAGAGVDIYAINGGNYQQTGTQVLTFSESERVELRANNQSSGIAAANTFGGYDLEIFGNDGDDLIDVGFGILASIGDTTVFGGAGNDTLRLNDTTTFAPTTLLINQTGGLPFVDLFNGSQLVLYDSIGSLVIDAGPFNDTITSIAVPMETALTISGRDGVDTIDVQGHPTVNSALFPRVTVDGGAGNDVVQINTDGQGGARAAFTQSQTLGTLAIGASGRLRLDEGEHVIDVLNSVTMPASNFELDLTDGFFVRRGNPSFPFYESRVIVGYNAGAWNGLGINSSLAATSPLADALGLARASELFGGGGGVVDGIVLAANDILIRYTLYGDADLTGNVDSDDFNRLATSFGQTGTTWARGNFNFDNFTNSDDFNLLATNFGLSVASSSLSALPLNRTSHARLNEGLHDETAGEYPDYLT